MKYFLTLYALLYAASPAISAVPDITELDEVTELTQGGITWTFSSAVRAGQYVNGDYYVVGPCTVTTISPLPKIDSVNTANCRNGSVLNPDPATKSKSGYDGRSKAGRFLLSKMARLPIVMQPTDQLVSSISAANLQGQCFMETRSLVSYVKTFSILTCAEAPVATDAFRPGFCDRNANLYYADSLKTELLHSLAKVPTTPDIAAWAGYFRQPWAGMDGICYDNAQDYMPQYNVETVRAEAIATLLLNLNFTPAEKRDLLINFVQYGIDIYSIIRDGLNDGWKAVGGHGNGHKWGIVSAGMLLGDDDMANINRTMPDIKFGQDMHTAFTKDMPAGMQTCWNGSDVVYTGHLGIWQGEPAGTVPEHTPYEHLHPRDWPATTYQYSWKPEPSTRFAGEVYRRGQNSPAWVGCALAIRIMGAEEEYGHDAFCAYVDRWMTIDDGPLADTINVYRHPDDIVDYSENAAGDAFDPFVLFMWRFYRNNLPGSSGIKPVTDDRQGNLSLPLSFPNPVMGGTPVRFGNAGSGIAIADRMGRVIFRSRAQVPSVVWNGRRTDGTRPAPGIYIITANETAAQLLIH